MNNIWLILFLLAGFGQSDGCNKQPGQPSRVSAGLSM